MVSSPRRRAKSSLSWSWSRATWSGVRQRSDGAERGSAKLTWGMVVEGVGVVMVVVVVVVVVIVVVLVVEGMVVVVVVLVVVLVLVEVVVVLVVYLWFT